MKETARMFNHCEWELTAWKTLCVWHLYRKLMSVVFLFRSLRASSMFTTRHQLGLSTRKALQCFWTRCVLPQQHRLLYNRYLATTSCLSHLRSSFSLRPACSVGDLRRVKAFKKSEKKVDTVFPAILTEPYHVRSENNSEWPKKNFFFFFYCTAGHFLFVFCTCHKPHQT